jgi:hypothetical protein
MVYSTRNRDYNDPKLEDLGDGQQGEGSNQQPEQRPSFNLEEEFLKL